MDADKPVGGIRISREAGTTVRTASYLPTDAAVFCRFLSSRKVCSLCSFCRAAHNTWTRGECRGVSAHEVHAGKDALFEVGFLSVLMMAHCLRAGSVGGCGCESI